MTDNMFAPWLDHDYAQQGSATSATLLSSSFFSKEGYFLDIGKE